MKTRILSIILIVVTMVSISTKLAVPAHASYTEIALSYSDLFPQSLAIQGSSIILKGIPQIEKFQRIGFVFNSANSNADAVINFVSRDAQGNAVISTALKDGRYYLDIYTGSEKCDTLYSIIHNRKLEFVWQNNSGYFVPSKMYEHNKKAILARNNANPDQYLVSTDLIQSNHWEIMQYAERITKDSKTDYEKLLAIHDWVASYLHYDFDVYYGRKPHDSPSATTALQNKRAVCGGYANLTAAFLRSVGIPTRVVSGFLLGRSSAGVWTDNFDLTRQGNHAWNEAYVDGCWIILDVTLASGNEWEFGRKTVSNGIRSHRYFDITPIMFSATHALKV